MKVRIKSKINSYGRVVWLLQYRRLFFWRTADDCGSLESAIETAKRLSQLDIRAYTLEEAEKLLPEKQ